MKAETNRYDLMITLINKKTGSLFTVDIEDISKQFTQLVKAVEELE